MFNTSKRRSSRKSSRVRKNQSCARAAIESLENRTLLSAVYDASAGFSTAHNPNAPWAYGYSTSETSPFILYNSENHSQGIYAWTFPHPPAGVPAVFKNATSAAVFLCGGSLAAGQLFFDPGLNGEYSHIRFTVPTAGNYSISASFFGASQVGTTTDVHILYNGKSLFDGEVTGYLSTSTISKSLSIANVAKGATIDLIVGDGANGRGDSDQTGVTATITQTAPATISGTVFSDANANGKQDTGEKGLAGVQVYIDATHAGHFVPGDPSTVTSATGAYSFTGLAVGTYIVRDEPLTGYVLTAPKAGDLTVTVGSGQVATGNVFAETAIGPFGGKAAGFGRIQAENFDLGGQGTAYSDPGNINKGGLYRPTEGVGIGAIPTADGGGYFVGWTVPGEYLNYTATVAATGTYTLDFRVASQPKGGTFHFDVDGKNVTGELSVPSTGDWNVYTIVSKAGVKLTAGTHLLRLVIDSHGTGVGAAGNFDWFEAVPPNLLVNGNFSAGASGFSSQYPNKAIAGGGYIVASNPTAFGDTTWLSFGDHTTGTGLMMLVDASTVPNQAIWQETVNVSAATLYSFAGWVANVHNGDDPPRLAIYVNNVQIGSTFNVPSAGGIWNPFGATWNSGASKTATIKIVDLNTDIDGNDFALDDFSFGI